MKALQEFAELYLTNFFEDSVYCAQICEKLITLMPKNMELARSRLRGTEDHIYSIDAVLSSFKILSIVFKCSSTIFLHLYESKKYNFRASFIHSNFSLYLCTF